MEERFVSDKEAAALYSMNRQSLANWRAQGKGPPYVKLGRAVRYKVSDLVSFAEKKKVEVRD